LACLGVDCFGVHRNKNVRPAEFDRFHPKVTEQGEQKIAPRCAMGVDAHAPPAKGGGAIRFAIAVGKML